MSKIIAVKTCFYIDKKKVISLKKSGEIEHFSYYDGRFVLGFEFLYAKYVS